MPSFQPSEVRHCWSQVFDSVMLVLPTLIAVAWVRLAVLRRRESVVVVEVLAKPCLRDPSDRLHCLVVPLWANNCMRGPSKKVGWASTFYDSLLITRWS